jgi:methionyl-tRNA formyltransferase
MSNLTVFMFHDVRDPPFTYPKRYEMRSFLRIETFKERIEFIEKKYNVVSLEDVVNGKVNHESNIQFACLTFDDGLADHFNTVFPFLKSKNLPATFFVPSECVRNQYVIDSHKIQFLIGSCKDLSLLCKEIMSNKETSLWDEYSKSLWKNNHWSKEEVFITRFLRLESSKELLENLFKKYVKDISNPEKDFYMTVEQVKILHKNGFCIGGHGKFSSDLSKISKEKQIEELEESKKFLEEIGVDTLLFSYPNGGYNDFSISVLRKLGFKGAVITGEQKTSIKPENLLTIPRIDASQYTFSPKVVLLGVQKQGLEIAEYLLEQGIPITDIVTIDEKESIRQKASGWIDYTKEESCSRINVHHCKHYGLKSEEDYEFFQRKRFDLLILGGWQRLIPENILRTVKYGGIGQHGSSDFLPKYRGRSPLNWSIILGKKRLVWHLFEMTPNVDDGDIIDFEIFDITEWDTCETMYFKVSIAVKNMLKRTIPGILNRKEGKQIRTKQQGQVSFYSKRTPEDGKIDWNKSIYELHRLIRGVTFPYPGAFTFKGESKVIIWEAQPFSQNLPFYIDKQYGEIVEVFSKDRYVVKAEEGLLLVLKSTDSNPKVGEIYT